jgi:hypothetical protein
MGENFRRTARFVTGAYNRGVQDSCDVFFRCVKRFSSNRIDDRCSQRPEGNGVQYPKYLPESGLKGKDLDRSRARVRIRSRDQTFLSREGIARVEVGLTITVG